MNSTTKTITVFDRDDNTAHKITVQKFDGHYRVNVDGEFWATCEMWNEVDVEIGCIVNMYRWNWYPVF